jgi:cysteinyl-tRNA synthetase
VRLSLYDSLTKRTEPVAPQDGRPLTVYSCGPTVYGYIHVGNARPFWIAMVLKRFCEQRLGQPVRLAINITDINDKIYVAATAAGKRSDVLAREMAQAYIDDTSGLGLGRPDAEPLATETIGPIITLIGRLIRRGLAYESHGDVYFRVAAFEGYGELSGQRTDELLEIEPGERKEAPPDFALWKAQKPGEDTAWESPWGLGRPGWHIECSAMAREELGDGFDVHGGGLDLVFPHHENERAQSLGAGEQFARRWMHNGMLRLSDEKMSKSLGNVEKLRDALARHGAETLCAYFASAHYRSPIDYTDAALEQARSTNDGFREALRSARRYVAAGGGGADASLAEGARTASKAFDAAMADDLGTPEALSALHALRRALSAGVGGGQASPASVAAAADELVACLDVLGLAGLDASDAGSNGGLPAGIEALLAERQAARAAKDFARADAARDRIAALGYQVRDTPQGPELVPLEG